MTEAKMRLIGFMLRKIKSNAEFAQEYSGDVMEHTQAVKDYAEILIHLIKEGLLP